MATKRERTRIDAMLSQLGTHWAGAAPVQYRDIVLCSLHDEPDVHQNSRKPQRLVESR
jgi:hypothetical protein